MLSKGSISPFFTQALLSGERKSKEGRNSLTLQRMNLRQFCSQSGYGRKHLAARLWLAGGSHPLSGVLCVGAESPQQLRELWGPANGLRGGCNCGPLGARNMVIEM